MQSYEHIWTILAAIANRGGTKEQALKTVREYGAYVNLTDSIRSEIDPTSDGRLKAYRPLSHFSDGAWMELPFGDALKNFKGLEEGKYSIPDNAERKAADGPTDIKSFVEHNKEFLKDRRSAFTLAHLMQDTVTDKIIQEDMATTYYTSGTEQDDDEIVSLYGYDVKGGLCKFNQTGKIVSMNDFRNVVNLVFILTSAKLWRTVKSQYPDLTMDEVADSIKTSYSRDYNENMLKTASQYAKPGPTLENLIEQDILQEPIQISGFEVQSISDVEDKLIEAGAFNSRQEINNKVEQTIRECINVFDDSKTIEDGEIHDDR